jgi:hypothetical protein
MKIVCYTEYEMPTYYVIWTSVAVNRTVFEQAILLFYMVLGRFGRVQKRSLVFYYRELIAVCSANALRCWHANDIKRLMTGR